MNIGPALSRGIGKKMVKASKKKQNPSTQKVKGSTVSVNYSDMKPDLQRKVAKTMGVCPTCKSGRLINDICSKCGSQFA